MKKYLSILLLFVCSYSFSQTVQQRAGFYPNGQLGKIYNDTIYSLVNTPLKYFTGYGTFGSFYDTSRAAVSLTTTGSGAATYNSSTGVFNIPTPSVSSSDSAIWKNSATYTAGDKTLTMGGNSEYFKGGKLLADSLRVGFARIYNNAQGLNISFADSTASNTTNSNIDITNIQTVSTNIPTQDNITGFGNVKMFASSANKPKSAGNQTISGNNNTLLNSSSVATLSGSTNTVIGSYSLGLTSGSNNIGIGIQALNGITTGSSNVFLTTTNGGYSAATSNVIVIGDATENNLPVAGDILLAAQRGGQNNLWLGGRISLSNSLISAGGANTTSNAIGKEFYIRTSAGNGLGLPGPLYFQTTKSGSTGSTLQTTYTTRMLMDTTGVAMGSALNSTPATLPNKAATAILDIQSTTQSFLPPRMTTAQRDVIVGVVSITVSGTNTTPYTGSSVVTISGGGGTGATAASTGVTGGNINGITVINTGVGYTSAPTVTVSIGAGQTFTAVLGTPEGSTIYNLTTHQTETYNGTSWVH